METALMSCTKLSASDDIRQIAQLIDDVVTSYRNRGYTRQYATEQAALALGITSRRAKSFLYGEVYSVAAHEYRLLKYRFLTHLDDEAEHLSERLAAIRERRAQMEMDL